MYIRFVAPQLDRDSGSLQGVFLAAAEVRDSGCLEPYEYEWLQETLSWFNQNLPVPPCYKKGGCERALCWFLDNADAPLERIWDLVALLREYGTPVRMIRTDEPGRIVYRDAFQVVAFPPRWRLGRRRQLRRCRTSA
jgi:hypothetical protein